MKKLQTLASSLELLIRLITLLEILWLAWLAITGSPLATKWSLLVALAAFIVLPSVYHLEEKWPPLYQTIAMGMLCYLLFRLSNYQPLVGGFLLLAAIIGSIPKFSYSLLALFLPFLLYWVGYFQNSIQQRLWALILALCIFLMVQLTDYLREISAAIDLEKAKNQTYGSFLSVSQGQFKLLVGCILTIGSSVIFLILVSHPFKKFVYHKKNVPSTTFNKPQESLPNFPSGKDTLVLEDLAKSTPPNQFLVNLWQVLEGFFKILLVVGILFLAFYIFSQMFHYLRQKNEAPMPEELPATSDFILLAKPTKKRRTRLSFGDYNSRVRRLFKKEVKKTATPQRTPEELIAAAKLEPEYGKRLLQNYQQARYDKHPITKEQWQALKKK